MIGHLLGDFYLQTDNLSQKKDSLKYLLLHVVTYALCIYCVAILATGLWDVYICPMIIIGGLHFIIDYAKIKLAEKSTVAKRHKLLILMIDQAIHIIILYFFEQMYLFQINSAWLATWTIHLPESIGKILSIVIAVLICGKPAAIIVAMIFEKIPQTIKKAEDCDGTDCSTESAKIGSWIGMLEREIILLLGLSNQYGAIGFVLAAKSLARHNQLNQQAFAEKYLVGTLLSALIALICVTICNFL